MTAGKRVLLGSTFGAIFALFLHPVSRSIIVDGIFKTGPSRLIAQSPSLAENYKVLPDPGSPMKLELAAVWVQAAAERLSQNKELSFREVSLIRKLCREAAVEDGNNALWPAFLAVIDLHRGNLEQARVHWLQASTRERFRDYQGQRLLELTRTLGVQGERSWHYMAAYSRRRSEVVAVILGTGRTLLRRTSLPDRETLSLRLAVLNVGRLVRDGSGSIGEAEYGRKLIELATYPSGLLNRESPLGLALARNNFLENLIEAGYLDDATSARRAFVENEAYGVFAPIETVNDRAREFTLGSVLAASLPGAMLPVALCGLLALLSSVLLGPGGKFEKMVATPWPQVVGAVVAVVIYFLSSLGLLAITVVLCIGFLGFTPPRTRSRTPEYFGPLFRFVILVLATALATLIVAWFVGRSTPAQELLPTLSVPREYFGDSSIAPWLGVIVCGLVCIVATAWAFQLRVPTVAALGNALRELGGALVFIGALGCIILTPVAIEVNRRLITECRSLVANEPSYYISR